MQRFTLDKSVRIEQNVGTLDEYGHKDTANWLTIADTRARVLYINGREFTQAEQLVDINTFDFIVRYRAIYLTAELRIIYAGYVYEVFQIEELNRKGFLRIRAQKKIRASLFDFLLESDEDFETEAEQIFQLEKSI